MLFNLFYIGSKSSKLSEVKDKNIYCSTLCPLHLKAPCRHHNSTTNAHNFMKLERSFDITMQMINVFRLSCANHASMRGQIFVTFLTYSCQALGYYFTLRPGGGHLNILSTAYLCYYNVQLLLQTIHQYYLCSVHVQRHCLISKENACYVKKHKRQS